VPLLGHSLPPGVHGLPTDFSLPASGGQPAGRSRLTSYASTGCASGTMPPPPAEHARPASAQRVSSQKEPRADTQAGFIPVNITTGSASIEVRAETQRQRVGARILQDAEDVAV